MKTNLENSDPLLTFVDEGRIARIDYKDPGLHPLVSVIVPIFGAERTLDEALASIEVQNLRDLEIVCVNDASTDRSAQIIAAHANQDSRYVVLDHICNCGYGASMNDGIAAARGIWIAILEPDDYLLPEMYEQMLAAPSAFAVRADEVDIIKTPYIRELRENGAQRGDAAKELLNCRYRGLIKPADQPFNLTDPGVQHLLRHHPSIWSALYKRTFLGEEQIRFHEYPGSGWADNEFFYDTLLRARSVIYLDEPFYVYREETEAEFASFARDRKLLRFERWQGMADIIDRLGIEAESIRSAHVAKGFTYLGEQIATWGEDDVDVRKAMTAMFERMDPALVAQDALIPPHLKALYFNERGIERSGSADKARYYQALAKEFAHTLRSNGFSYAFGQVKNVLGR